MSEPCWTWKLDRNIPSDPDEGRAVIEEILAHLRGQAWLDHDVFCVHLALEEAMLNAIEHGNCRDPDKCVRILCRTSPARIRIEITDEGPGFCPGEVPDPTDADHINLPSGRGIMLMRNFMSLVEYNQSGNGLIMEKERQA